ncbi:MAG: SUMF1/EgtB/PvdO family nonheme iron enzyme [Planctomycetota bacterium]
MSHSLDGRRDRCWHCPLRGGVPNGPNRVLRGGSFANTARNARSAYRNGNAPTTRNPNIGFRPAQCTHRWG